MIALPSPRALARLFLALVALALWAGACAAAPLEALRIVTTTGPHDFRVEVARTDEEHATGLMFRKSMPRDQGMLFDFKRSQPIFMWMKNTYLPLDMVFIDAHGGVVGVAENTVPMSEKIIPSGKPVLGVLEVNAGTAKAIGLKAGDRIVNPMFH